MGDLGTYDERKQATDLDLLGADKPPDHIYERGATPQGYVWDHIEPPSSGEDFDELRANVKAPEPARHVNRPSRGVEGYEDPVTKLFEDLF